MPATIPLPVSPGVPVKLYTGPLTLSIDPRTDIWTGWYMAYSIDGALQVGKDGEQIVEHVNSYGSNTVLNPGFETRPANTGLRTNVHASSIWRAANVAHFTAPGHGLITGDIVTISGFIEPTFNAANVTVTRVNDNEFTYPNSGVDINPDGLEFQQLANTGFEITGSPVFANWTSYNYSGVVSRDTTDPHSGTACCKVPDAVTFCGQPIYLWANVTYRLTLWARGDGTNDAHIVIPGVLTTRTNDTSTTWKQYIYDMRVTTSGWRELQLTGGNTAGKFVLYDDVTLVTLYYDTAGKFTAPIFTEWILEPGTAPMSVETALQHEGAYALIITSDGADNHVYQDFAVIAGHKYDLQFWSRGDGTNAARWRLEYIMNGDLIPTRSTWNESEEWFITSYQVNCSYTDTLRLYLYGSTAPGGISWFDDVSMIEEIDGWFEGESGGQSLDPGYWPHSLEVTLDQLTEQVTINNVADTLIPSNFVDLHGSPFSQLVYITDPGVTSEYTVWASAACSICDAYGEQITNARITKQTPEEVILEWDFEGTVEGNGFQIFQEYPAGSGNWQNYVNLIDYWDNFTNTPIKLIPDYSDPYPRYAMLAWRQGGYIPENISPSALTMFTYSPPAVVDEPQTNMRNECHFRR